MCPTHLSNSPSVTGVLFRIKSLIHWGRDGPHFAGDILKCVFLNKNVLNSLKISLKSVPKFRINNILALVQIMAWCRSGVKPLSVPMMLNLLTHICVTRYPWVADFHVYIHIFCNCNNLKNILITWGFVPLNLVHLLVSIFVVYKMSYMGNFPSVLQSLKRTTYSTKILWRFAQAAKVIYMPDTFNDNGWHLWKSPLQWIVWDENIELSVHAYMGRISWMHVRTQIW